VPVDGVRIIFEAVLNCFAGIDYEADEFNITPIIQEEHIDIYNAEAREEMYLIEKEPEYCFA